MLLEYTLLLKSLDRTKCSVETSNFSLKVEEVQFFLLTPPVCWGVKATHDSIDSTWVGFIHSSTYVKQRKHNFKNRYVYTR